MKNLRPEDENIIKDIRNLFRLEKETKAVKDRILRDIKNLFEHQEENYYKPVTNFWSNKYIEYEGNSDKKNYPLKNILIKLFHILKTNNLQKSDRWKIQLIIANYFIYSIHNVKEHVCIQKVITQIMINEEADEVIKGLF